ncbi:hypothetical protein FNV43_RR25006 [Rhamnella rubrinervis]|uniref:Uncharacterized protein n=1 Tax=Rhamnella rubrinervis TaxID=2594499 RepID=A0A8K0GR86_9ROSA|nr:hypothetical protein FNV43_RR25006 [Rhamnella rubrinervis]
MGEDHENDAVFNLSNTPSDLDLFEFFVNNEATCPTSSEPIVFCGKTIPAIEADPKTSQYHYYAHPANGHFIRRDSFKRSRSFRSKSVKSPTAIVNRLNSSTPSPVAMKCGFRNGGEFRRHRVLIGLVKLQPEMEMSEIRKRRNRGSPTSGYGDVEAVADTCELRPFRLRSYLLNALTKGFV